MAFFFFFFLMDAPIVAPTPTKVIPLTLSNCRISSWETRIAGAFTSLLSEASAKAMKLAPFSVDAVGTNRMLTVVEECIKALPQVKVGHGPLGGLFSLWPSSSWTALADDLYIRQSEWWNDVKAAISIGMHPTLNVQRDLSTWLTDAGAVLATQLLGSMAQFWNIRPATAEKLLEISKDRSTRTLAQCLKPKDFFALKFAALRNVWLETYMDAHGMEPLQVTDKERVAVGLLLYGHAEHLWNDPIQSQNELLHPSSLKALFVADSLDRAYILLERIIREQAPAGKYPPLAALPEPDAPPLAAFPSAQPTPGPLVGPVPAPAPTLKEIRYKAEPRNPATNKCWRAEPNLRALGPTCSGDHDLWSCQLYICPICRVKAAGHNPPSCPHAKGKEREYHFSPQRKK